MKHTILFALLNQFADWEAAYLSSAIAMLGQGMLEVKTLSLTKEPVTSIGGLKVAPDFDLKTAPADYDGLILVGGFSWRKEPARQIEPLVLDAFQRRKILGGICDAAGFLATTGVLNTVHHTANNLADIQQWAGERYAGAERFVHRQAVRDGNVVTANGTAPLEFAKETLLALNVGPEQKIQEWYEFHKLGYYCAALPGM